MLTSLLAMPSSSEPRLTGFFTTLGPAFALEFLLRFFSSKRTPHGPYGLEASSGRVVITGGPAPSIDFAVMIAWKREKVGVLISLLEWPGSSNISNRRVCSGLEHY